MEYAPIFTARELITLADVWLAATNVKESALSRAAFGNVATMVRMRFGASCRLDSAERASAWFASAFAERGIAWPTGVRHP